MRNRELIPRVLLGVTMAAGAAPAAAQVEIRLHFTALERMLASQVFTQDGRKFVKGKHDQQCNFAYLEKPRIGHEQSRLRIQARFTGRSAINLLGKCVGMGDAFDLTIFTNPHYKEGSAVFRNVMVESYGKDSFYKRTVRQTIARSLERDVRYPLAAEARRLLEQGAARTGYKPELSNFDVASIEVNESAIVFRLRFHLDVK